MDYTPTLIAAFATLTAAAIAASVSLIVTILAKEGKTSEMRQQWIDALRSDLALFVAEAMVVQVIVSVAKPAHATPEERKQFFDEYKSHGATLVSLQNKILLRLNPVEHVKLLALIVKLGEQAPALQHEETDTSAMNVLAGEVIEASREMLKAEWERVKRGETAFVAAKWAAVAVVGLALSAIAWNVIRAM